MTGRGFLLQGARGKGGAAELVNVNVRSHEPLELPWRDVCFVGRRSEYADRCTEYYTEYVTCKAEEYCTFKVMRATRSINQQRDHQANGF